MAFSKNKEASKARINLIFQDRGKSSVSTPEQITTKSGDDSAADDI